MKRNLKKETPKIHWEVLTKEQKKLLSKLKFLKKMGFYLAGGTGLALQIGHRTSIDFDFYRKKEFDGKILAQQISKTLPNLEHRFIGEGTLRVAINNCEVSFFYYPYDLIQKPLDIGVLLASKEDIAAMKLLAIADRGTRRDFIDLYFLIQEFGVSKIFSFLQKKYPRYDPYHALVGLTYFVDADKIRDQKRFNLLKPAPSWPKMKEYFRKIASEFKKELLK